MSERTLTQITRELEQVASQVASLELEIASKREKLTNLLNEQIALQSQTLSHFNMRLVLQNGSDSLPIVATKRRRAAVAATSGTDRKRNALARAWAIQTKWKDSTGKPVSARGPMPTGLVEAFEKAST